MLPTFIQIGPPTTKIWCHIDFSRWRPRPLNTTSGFVFVDVTAFRRSKYISRPNFVDISESTVKIKLLPFLKNKRPSYWNSTTGFYLEHFAVICMLFCIRLSNFVQIGAPIAEICHIHFSRWRPRPLNTTSGFLFVDVTAFRRAKSISEPNFVHISQSMLNYNYFRFWKTNVHHIGNLLPVFIPIISP